MRNIVYGSIVYDRIMNFPGYFKDHILAKHIHRLNVSFMVNEFNETFGGAGANIAYNLSLLDENCKLFGSVGRDFEEYKNHFSKLDIKGVKIHQNDLTASAYIITDKADNQITGFFPGAMRYHCISPKFKRDDLVIISPGNANEMLDFAESCSKAKVPFIFDPGQQIIQFTKDQIRQVLRLSTIYIVNDYELSLTEKISGINKKNIHDKTGVLITTLGSKGSIIDLTVGTFRKTYRIKPVKVNNIVDPTGAGDAYRAGLIKGINLEANLFKQMKYSKMSWTKIGQMGSLASTYAIEKYGTQRHSYTYNQFKNKYKLIFKEKL